MYKFFIITLACFVLINKATKLNYPRVLLPIFDTISINFTLQVVEDGCYKWMTSRSDLVKITQIYTDSNYECSSQAVVTVLTREKRRNTAIVLAEEITTGEILRCDVILDMIVSLGVLTTTRELYLEEAPETFELWAQDSQGNAFTSLEGVEFEWSIDLQNNLKKNKNIDITWQQVLRFLPFSESKYHEIPKEIQYFESIGLKGHMVLLEGIYTGSAKVSVRLPHPEYHHIPPIEVDIMVLANIILDPSEVYLLVDDIAQFRVLQLKQGKMQEIAINKQYYLEIEDKTIAEISGQKVKGKKLGRTAVILRDRNVPSEKNSNNPGESPTPRANLIVTTANQITINLLPYYNWITVEGEKHEIAIDLYNSDNQKIYLGTKYSINSKFDETIFFVLNKTLNGNRIYGEAAKLGTTEVIGTFNKLTAKAELHVFNELHIKPKRVILPLEITNTNTNNQHIEFIATGGDNNYLWSSQNQNILSITQNGIAEIKMDKIKKFLNKETKEISKIQTTVKVALLKNPKLYRIAEILFLPPVKLEIIKYNFETSLQDYVKLHIAIYTNINGTLIPFTNCNNIPFEFEFTNQIFNVESNNHNLSTEFLHANACTIIYLRATNTGYTQLRLQYNYFDEILKDEVTLIVFEKLNVLNPVENMIILPIGSSRNIIYTNGPYNYYNIEAELNKNLNFDRSIIEISEIKQKNSNNIHSFSVLCRKVGDTKIKFEIYNKLHVENFESYITNFITNVYCVKPRFINLYATEKLRDNCPLEIKNSIIHIQNQEENIEVEIEILDVKNRKLMNISSLVIDWTFLPENLKYKMDLLHYREAEEDIIEDIRIPSKDFLITTINDITKSFKIKAIVTEYSSTVLNYYDIFPEIPHFGIQKPGSKTWSKPIIENEINFMAVNKTLLPSDTISIFMTHNRTERIPILQGSGLYEFILSGDKIISIDFDTKSKELVIVPHQIGNTKIEISDRCLITDSVILSVLVVSIGLIKVQVPDQVQKSKDIEAIIKLYDSNEELLNIDYKNLHIYDLNVDIFNPTILHIKLGNQKNLEKGEIRYIISGLSLGETKVVFNAGQEDKKISSDPANIQVFPPLQLYPRNATLIVGSSIQIRTQGGPQPNINIIYSIQNQNVISMDSAIVLAKKLGTTKITGKCIGFSTIRGKKIILSEDTIDIHVIPLDKIEIRTPLVRIKSGALMPAFIWGIPDISPMVLGTLDTVRVVWTTDQPDIIDIFGIFSEAGIEYSDRDLITMRIKANNPGKAIIKAIVILPGGQRLTSSLEITVVKLLELESPKKITLGSILIAPRSSIQLKPNLDDVSFSLSEDTSGIVTITSDGILKSTDKIGIETIIAKTFDQTLPIEVEVKNIHYIHTSLSPFTIKLKKSEEKIPRGINFVLKVTIYDNLGNEFSHNIEEINSIKYELSHKDLIDVHLGQNLTILLNLPRETSSMMEISLKDHNGVKYAEDFIKLSVSECKNIFPTKSIFSVGDVICFESPLISASPWISSNEKVLSIDSNSGIARILCNQKKLGEKIAVFNGEKQQNNIRYDIEVREANKIEFFKSYDVFSGDSYRAHLVIRNHLQIDKYSNLIAKNVTKCGSLVNIKPEQFFVCQILSKYQETDLISQNFITEPFFDKTSGTYACDIKFIGSHDLIMNFVKQKEFNIQLEALLTSGISDIISLRIIPGIKIKPDSIFIDELAKTGLTITGLEDVLKKVEVKSSDSSIIDLIAQAKMHGSLQYKVKIKKQLPSEDKMYILISSPLTLQNFKLPIHEANTVQMCSNQPFGSSAVNLINIISNIGFIISTIFILCLTIWVFFYCFSSSKTPSVNNYAFSTNQKSFNNLSSNGQSPKRHSSVTPLRMSYPSSPYFPEDSITRNTSTGSISPVYGDSTLASPQKRINRRYL